MIPGLALKAFSESATLFFSLFMTYYFVFCQFDYVSPSSSLPTAVMSLFTAFLHIAVAFLV